MARTYGALSDQEEAFSNGSFSSSELPDTPVVGGRRRLIASFILVAAGLSAVAAHSRHVPTTSVTTLAAPPSTKPDEASPTTDAESSTATVSSTKSTTSETSATNEANSKSTKKETKEQAETKAKADTKSHAGSNTRAKESKATWNFTAAETSNSTGLLIEVTNNYTAKYGPVGLDYPWLGSGVIVEPSRLHTFSASGVAVDDCESAVADSSHSFYGYECVARWTLRDNAGALLENLEGVTAVPVTHSTVFTSAEEYTLSVDLHVVPSSGPGTLLSSKTATLYSRYVRREVRKYFEEDRDRLVSTMRLLFDLSDIKGQAHYGTSYRSMEYFVKKHTELAGATTCDHLHEGLGFLTNHMAFSLEFEMALQVVDPTLSLPYWDYTIDANDALTAELETGVDSVVAWRNSVVFTDEWFGTSTPANELQTMTTGVWAYTPVMKATGAGIDGNASSVPVQNAFGYLRAPWNTNKGPYVARYNRTFEFDTDVFPMCSDYIDVLNYDSWLEFGQNIANGAHGPIHGMIGGAWKANFSGWESAEKKLGTTQAKLLVYLAVASYPQFWRDGIIECPDSCSQDTPISECQCACATIPQDDDDDETTSTTAPQLLQRSGVFERLARHDTKQKVIERKVDDVTGVISYSWVGVEDLDQASTTDYFFRIVCEVAQTGDMLGSSSPVDPIFWSVHPTVDRLWQWKRLNTDCAYNYSWPEGTSIYGTCSGHDEYDMLPYYGLNPHDTHRVFTNKGIYDYLDPAESTSPYVYDDFLWNHCLQEDTDVRNFCTGDSYDGSEGDSADSSGSYNSNGDSEDVNSDTSGESDGASGSENVGPTDDTTSDSAGVSSGQHQKGQSNVGVLTDDTTSDSEGESSSSGQHQKGLSNVGSSSGSDSGSSSASGGGSSVSGGGSSVSGGGSGGGSSSGASGGSSNHMKTTPSGAAFFGMA